MGLDKRQDPGYAYTMTALDLLKSLPLPSRERVGLASTNEKRRWLAAGGLWINAEKVQEKEQLDFPIISVVLFPGGKRVTLW